MKFGFVYLSYVYSEDRVNITRKSLDSLCNTNMSGLDFPIMGRPVLMCSINPSNFDYKAYEDKLRIKFNVGFMTTNAPLNTMVVTSIDTVLRFYPDITHIGMLYDDFVFNSEWLQQLYALVKRHPEARAWSVYRSLYTRHHWITGGDGVDVTMSMHDGMGLMTREEWNEYNPSKIVDFTCPESMGGGCTIDIHHAYARPGKRWATTIDYMQNLGRHKGIENVDCAINFAGE